MLQGDAMITKKIFSKVCKCGNEMGIVLRKYDLCVELKVEYKKGTLSPNCFMVGDSTVQCADCSKRYRSYHRAYVVESRTWKESE